METFTKARDFVTDRGYVRARQKALAALNKSALDKPIADIVSGFCALPHCFTLQCCYGHFLCDPAQDRHCLDPVPLAFSGRATYRLAYIALCLEYSPGGQALRQSLVRLTAIDPRRVQFGSADWFWERWVNSYVLQVEPAAQMTKDEVILGAPEARRIQWVRDLLYQKLRVLLARELSQLRRSE